MVQSPRHLHRPQVLESYTARTNGSSIQTKGSALVWKFDEVDPDFGEMQAKEVHLSLTSALADSPIQVKMGKGYIEVRASPAHPAPPAPDFKRTRVLSQVKPAGVDKGAIVDHLISLLYSQSGGVDFILCIGDDAADEYMFQVMTP